MNGTAINFALVLNQSIGQIKSSPDDVVKESIILTLINISS